MEERRRDIDWLRIIAMASVFVFHCTRPFDTEGWHVKNAEQSFVMFVALRGLMWPWIMELFFLLSGVGTWYALKSRTAGSFLLERIKRLLIPLYTVGLFIMLPPQLYFELRTNAGYDGSFWEIFPRYFGELGLPSLTMWPTTLLPVPFCGHLWFLQYLFLISLATLPLLIFLKSARGRLWIERVAGLMDRRGGIFLIIIPLALVLICLRSVFSVERGWAEFVWYAVYFVLGYMIPADSRFSGAFSRHGWICLALWIIGFAGGVAVLVLVAGYDPAPGHELFSPLFVLYQTVWSITSWSAVVFMLNVGIRHLNFNSRALGYGNEAVLPFYLFHQTIILVVAFFAVRWDMGILPKLAIVILLSFPLIMALYELAVRRFNIVRFLFGMKPLKRPSGESRAATSLN